LNDDFKREGENGLTKVTFGGPKGTFATPKVETFFDLTIGTHMD
jgi:hypothetical protein